MSQRVVQVDAFTAVPFAGNPAAVCIMNEAREDEWMQRVAMEMNLSETAFLVPEQDGYRLRWFTPTAEVDLCGHATLASAHVLWEDGVLPANRAAVFYSRSGRLGATRHDGWITLDFPAQEAVEVDPPAGLIEALGVTPSFVGRNAFDYLVEVANARNVLEANPDLTRLRAVPCRGVILTSRSDEPEYDFVSRFFAPAVGVDEDPVTGSAHCCLAPYWAERIGRTELVGFQASARGGIVRVRVHGERVLLSGQAITVMHGELFG